MSISPKDISWIAGIIEGEGNFGFDKQNKHWRISINVKMADVDIIERLQEVTRVGVIYGPYHDGNYKHSWQYSWRVTVQKDASALMMTIYPIMGIRRQKEIREKLNVWKSYPYPHQKSCPKNHPIENIYWNSNNQKVCRECKRLIQIKYRENKYLGF